jgi:hypothetical protein
MSRRAIEADVTPLGTIERMTLVRRIVKLAAAAVAFALYVWFTAVRAAPSIRRRKALRRASRNP